MAWQRRKGQAASSTARSGGQGLVKKKWESFWFQVGSAVCRCVVTSCERRVVKSHSCNRVVSKDALVHLHVPRINTKYE